MGTEDTEAVYCFAQWMEGVCAVAVFFFFFNTRILQTYKEQSVARAGFALAMLYCTVLRCCIDLGSFLV